MKFIRFLIWFMFGYVAGYLLGLLLFSGVSLGAPKLKLVKERTVFLSGPIIPGGMEPVCAGLLKYSKKNSKLPTYMVIESPGGSAYEYLDFISCMKAVKAQGTRIVCVVRKGALSAAFQILLHCDERHALENSLLLWHPVRVSVRSSIKEDDAEALLDALRDLNYVVYRDIREYVPLNYRALSYHFTHETAHRAESLPASFVKVHSVIRDLYEVDTWDIPKNDQPDFLMRLLSRLE